MWASRDMATWDNSILPANPFGSAIAAAVGNEFRIIVGATDPSSSRRFVLWLDRGDGRWLPVLPAASGFASADAVLDIAWYAGRFVAVGLTSESREAGLATSRAGIWTSPDGTHWESAEIHLARERGSRLTRIAAGPLGLIAGGEIEGDGGADALLVASADDGSAWSQVLDEDLGGDQHERVAKLVASDVMWLLALGVTSPACGEAGVCAEPARILASIDSRAWDTLGAGIDPPAAFGSVGDLFLGYAQLDDRYQVLESPDGFTWTIVGPPLPPGMFGVVFGSNAGRVVAAGVDARDEGLVRVWTLDPSDP